MLWGPLLTMFFLGYSLALSVLWTPFGVGLCMLLARRKGLSVPYYGIIGAAYSLLFVLPCIYLVTRLSGRRIPTYLIIATYSAVYTLWVFLLLGMYFYTYEEILWDSARPRVTDTRWEISLYPTHIGAVVAFVSTWVLAIDLKRRRNSRDSDQRFPEDYEHSLRDMLYLVPFVFLGIATGVPLWYFLGAQ